MNRCGTSCGSQHRRALRRRHRHRRYLHPVAQRVVTVCAHGCSSAERFQVKLSRTTSSSSSGSSPASPAPSSSSSPAPALSSAEEQQQQQRMHQRVQRTLDRTTLASRERIKVVLRNLTDTTLHALSAPASLVVVMTMMTMTHSLSFPVRACSDGWTE